MNQVVDTTQPAAEWVEVDALVPWVKNPRKNDAAVDKVAESIAEFGFGAPLIVRRANGEVIGGHTRLKAAIKMAMTHVPVRYLDLTEEQAHKLALADNKLGEAAEWDDKMLASVLADLSVDGIEGLGVTGFSEEEMLKLLAEPADVLGVTAPAANPPTTDAAGAPATTPPALANIRLVQLFFDGPGHEAFTANIRELSKLYGTKTATETVVEAVKRARDASAAQSPS
jgi:hypothetical protein